jgi:hypothetical protein
MNSESTTVRITTIEIVISAQLLLHTLPNKDSIALLNISHPRMTKYITGERAPTQDDGNSSIS